MRGRPFVFREEIGIWPSTFFLFILSAIAAGPSFLLLTTWLVERISGKRLVKRDVLQFLGRLSGILIIVYVLFKAVDTLIWINSTSPASGFPAFEYYERKEFGTWILLSEIILFGLVPGLILMRKRWRSDMRILLGSALMIVLGIALNRFVLTIQTLALPTLTFDKFLSYAPSWQEVAAFAAVIAYGVLLYSISFRYLPLFPQEREMARSQEARA
jgi:molybdopterin-containing oxidoreductase family membrane subunit